MFGFVLLLLYCPDVLGSTSSHLQASERQASGDVPQGTQYSLSVEAPLVVIDVLVTDEDGTVLSDLGKENFRILDDGKPQVISDFAPTTAPITIVILMEYSGIAYDYHDPTGFTRFFDKIATREGYIKGVSWFRTHPAFYERMVQDQREMAFLPAKPDAIVQTTEFEKMKKKLAPITAKAEKEEIGKPSLLITREEGCQTPKKLEYKTGERIEQVCAQPKP